MPKSDIETFYPKTQQAWRKWLQTHHAKKQSVRVIMYKKDSGKPSINWSTAVDEALCFGWVDSVRRSVDDEQFIQFFSRRKPTSTWSKINKDKVEQLIEKGLMTPAGLICIDIAKQNGSWNILDTVDAMTIPKDLEKAFKAQPGSKAAFLTFSKSVQKVHLQWLVLAKRPETRAKRIVDVVAMAVEQGKKKSIPKGK